MGKYPVIFLSLKGIDGLTFEAAKYRLMELIGVEAERFAFLADSEKLTENERSKYRAIIHLVNGKYSMDEDMLVSSLQALSQLLCRHYGQKAMILIDEYDVPLDKAFQHGYYKEMVSLIRGLFGQALKTNDDLQFAVLTGCLRVSKESIFTGLNNFKVYAADDVRYDEEFGFTNEGVKKLLANYNLQEHFEKVKEWYDGYHFGDADIYCPWDVINYVDDLVSDPLDIEGLAYAGGEWDSSKYKTFIPDDDNCIPITDEEYFEDDIVGRFCEFLKVVFGEESLEENLNYVAQALGNKGNTSREIIRNYFLNDFFKDHCSTYSVTGSGKRPIYWLFDAGKQNGFKCLIYMHRYDKDTVNRVRSEYLKKMQDAIEGALKNAEYAVDNSSSAVDRAAATRKRDKYIKQLNEIRAYYPALSHMALQRIEIDLDDGVKTNYAKFQGIETVDENGKKQKVDLLAKI